MSAGQEEEARVRAASASASLATLREVPHPNGKVDVRLPGKGNSHSHGARPVHLITVIKWIRARRRRHGSGPSPHPRHSPRCERSPTRNP